MKKSLIHLPESAQKVLATLEGAGYEAWVVGGFVRDAFMGQPGHDIDIATSAHWQQVQDACETAGLSTFETGIAHGTISVKVADDIVEVTTYRVEGAYSDARHPDSVEFVQNIEDDLARRDFTINAMAWHPKRGLCDPFNGEKDLAGGIIRAVGTPQERFAEDALRILRALRFASQLGFDIEKDTLAGAHTHLVLLDKIAIERIATELERLLCGAHAGAVLLDYPAIIDAVLPELAPMRGFNQRSPYHIYDVYEHTARVVAGVEPVPLLRWAALLHDCGKPASFTVGKNGQGHFYGHAQASAELAQRVLARLKVPSRLRHEVILLVGNHDKHRLQSSKAVKRMLRNLHEQPELFRALCALQRADAFAHAPGHQDRADIADEAEAILDEILAAESAFRLADLAITGTDLIQAGVEAGPRVGELLEEALEAVIDETLTNDHDTILCFLHLA